MRCRAAGAAGGHGQEPVDGSLHRLPAAGCVRVTRENSTMCSSWRRAMDELHPAATPGDGGVESAEAVVAPHLLLMIRSWSRP